MLSDRERDPVRLTISGKSCPNSFELNPEVLEVIAMGPSLATRVVCQEPSHPVLALSRPGDPEVPVRTRECSDGIGENLFELNVHELIRFVGVLLAHRHRVVERFGPPFELLLTDPLGIHRIGDDAPNRINEAGKRRDGLGGVSVRKDEAGIGVFVQQRIEGCEMHRTLEHPSIVHVTALKVLEEMPMIGIGRRGTLLVYPLLIARDVERDTGLRSEQALREDRHAFLRQFGPHLVNRGEGRSHGVHMAEVLARLLYPRVGGVGFSLRWGIRELCFPAHRGPVGGVMGEQVEQDGRAGPRKPDDEQRLLDRYARDLGMLCSMPVDREATLERRRHRLAASHTPDPVEICLTLHRIQQNRKSSQEALVAEPIRSRLTCSGLDYSVGIERRPTGSDRPSD